MKNKKIYYDIYGEFNSVNKFRELKSIPHHGNNRLSHTNRVAKMSFLVSRCLNLDYVSCTRGAFMHDFFTLEDVNKNDDKLKSFLRKHPNKALDNSEQYFDVNDIEKDIILSHMFPITKEKPEYMESKVVCICDKIVSIYEFIRYQVNFTFNLALLFCFKFIKY